MWRHQLGVVARASDPNWWRHSVQGYARYPAIFSCEYNWTILLEAPSVENEFHLVVAAHTVSSFNLHIISIARKSVAFVIHSDLDLNNGLWKGYFLCAIFWLTVWWADRPALTIWVTRNNQMGVIRGWRLHANEIPRRESQFAFYYTIHLMKLPSKLFY